MKKFDIWILSWQALWQLPLHILTAQAVAVGCVWCSWWQVSDFQCRIASLWMKWLCGYHYLDRIDIGIKMWYQYWYRYRKIGNDMQPYYHGNTKSQSWSWMIHSHPFHSRSICPPIPEIRLFHTLTLKIPCQGNGSGQRERSNSWPSIQMMGFLFVSHQSDLNNVWERESYFKISPWKLQGHDHRAWEESNTPRPPCSLVLYYLSTHLMVTSFIIMILWTSMKIGEKYGQFARCPLSSQSLRSWVRSKVKVT